ncbi:MAG: ArsR/SmtB family transcription factor [Nocardioidaceae bacterium]
MSFDPRRLRGASELKALAHPVRMAILEQLTIDGPLTASDLAEALSETPANCSYHLRTLAKYGFVVEAAGGVGRQRPWQAAQRGLSWADAGESTEVLMAADALSRVLVQREVARFEAARANRLGSEWDQLSTASQSVMWLTAAEVEQVQTDLRAVMTRYLDRFDDPGERPPGSRLVHLLSLLSVDGQRAPTPGPTFAGSVTAIPRDAS